MENENRRILERERYQIEQIRQLDLEELQVEEVDDLNYSSDDHNDPDPLYPYNSNRRRHGSAAVPGGFTYNTCIASLHTYLGVVEDTHHRTAFLDGGAVFTLPIFCLQGVVLFPGATLPLRVIESNFVAAVERALNQVDVPYTIGVIRVYMDTANHRMKSATIGTTAEIRQYGRLEDGSLNVVTRGQQRFRLRRCWIDMEGVPYGEIQIIDEDKPSRTPRDVFGKLTPLRNLPRSHAISSVLPSSYSGQVHGFKNEENDSEDSFESELSLTERRIHQSLLGSSYEHDIVDESASSGEDKLTYESDQESRSSLNDDTLLSLLSPHENDMENLVSRNGNCSTSGKQSSIREVKTCCKNIDPYASKRISRAFLPGWVYRMFDSYVLAQRAAGMWKQIVGTPTMEGLVKKPDVLSFCIASKIPVSESTRQELLDIDGISYRLRREIEILENIDLIRCKICQTIIAKRSDMLVMSSEGPLGAYVNSSGYVHEIATLCKAKGLALIGGAVTKYSWFPG